MQGHLWQIIQKHLDDYGVREAEFARRIGTSPQTVSSWKKRGVRSLPAKHLLVGVSDVTRRPYDEVLTAALHDTKYLPKEADDGTATNQAEVSSAETQAGPRTNASTGDDSQADYAKAAQTNTPKTRANRARRQVEKNRIPGEHQGEGPEGGA